MLLRRIEEFEREAQEREGMEVGGEKEGGEWDENIYVEVRVDVKLRGESAESGVIDRSGKGAGKERLKRVTKTISGVEARERVKLGR